MNDPKIKIFMIDSLSHAFSFINTISDICYSGYQWLHSIRFYMAKSLSFDSDLTCMAKSLSKSGKKSLSFDSDLAYWQKALSFDSELVRDNVTDDKISIPS